MKICDSLFNAINFEPAAVQSCCDVFGPRIPAMPFDGQHLDMKTYVAHIQSTLEDIQNEKFCKNCPMLREINVGDNLNARVLFETVSINTHRFFCNCKCVYCDLWKHKDRGYGFNPLPAIRSLKEQNALSANCSFHWGGGEPTILPYFQETSSWIMTNGFLQYVHTNAIIFSHTLDKAIKSGMTVINVSLDSSSPETYKKVKGVDQFNSVMNNISKYRSGAAAESLVLKYIVFEKNNKFMEIENFINICRTLEIAQIQYSVEFGEMKTGLSDKTLMGLALLRNHAAKFGISATPFCIPPGCMEKIAKMEEKLL